MNSTENGESPGEKPVFTEDDVSLHGDCVFIETPSGPVQIGVYSDSENDVDVTFVDHVNMGIRGEVNKGPEVVVDSCEWPTDLVLRDSENALGIDVQVDHHLSPKHANSRRGTNRTTEQ